MQSATYIILFVLFFTCEIKANPTFARQYKIACSSCHTQIPALTAMGLDFVRNGFRMSSYDKTALSSFLDLNDSTRHYPVGAIIGLSDNSQNDEINRIAKLYLSGTLTDSLSLMALSKETFSSEQNDQELFRSYNSQLYLQYNILESKHVLRAGLLTPLTQLGNIKRSMSNSGLHIQEEQGSVYKSPLQHANVKKIKGGDYSYKFDNTLLLLISYGNTIENDQDNDFSDAPGHNQSNQNNSDDAYLAGMNYVTNDYYRIGIVYNYMDKGKSDINALILPIEKKYEYFTWNTSLVYSDDSSKGEYYGMENALTFPLRDMEHVKLILNADHDENSANNFGYSIGYTMLYKMFYFTAVASRVNTETFNQSRLSGSISVIF